MSFKSLSAPRGFPRHLFSVACACFLLCSTLPLAAAPLESYSTNLASLIAPAKLATLGKRGANPRIQKAVALLEDARLAGHPVSLIASNAVVLAHYTNTLLATLTFDSLTRNHAIADRLGVLPAGLAEMRRGKSPTVNRGPYENDLLTRQPSRRSNTAIRRYP